MLLELREKCRPSRICCSLDLSGCASAPSFLTLLLERRLVRRSRRGERGVLLGLRDDDEWEDNDPATLEDVVVAVVTELVSHATCLAGLTPPPLLVLFGLSLRLISSALLAVDAVFFFCLALMVDALFGDIGGLRRFLRDLVDADDVSDAKDDDDDEFAAVLADGSAIVTVAADALGFCAFFVFAFVAVGADAAVEVVLPVPVAVAGAALDAATLVDFFAVLVVLAFPLTFVFVFSFTVAPVLVPVPDEVAAAFCAELAEASCGWYGGSSVCEMDDDEELRLLELLLKELALSLLLLLLFLLLLPADVAATTPPTLSCWLSSAFLRIRSSMSFRRESTVLVIFRERLLPLVLRCGFCFLFPLLMFESLPSKSSPSLQVSPSLSPSSSSIWSVRMALLSDSTSSSSARPSMCAWKTSCCETVMSICAMRSSSDLDWEEGAETDPDEADLRWLSCSLSTSRTTRRILRCRAWKSSLGHDSRPRVV
mmetsp:Transcript_3324/g.9453  ORF Transcript_3324/g.9453 Transcript_3324/m.9453 type:complete len:483 (-) Transcript_3324:1081-2529(-)